MESATVVLCHCLFILWSNTCEIPLSFCVFAEISMEFQCFEIQIKTEADSYECSHDDKPSTGMFTVSDSRGLVVTSGALPEPSSQLIHNRCIDEEIKFNQSQKPTFTELEPSTNLLLEALTTQTEPNPYHQRTRMFCHVAENVPLSILSQNSVHDVKMCLMFPAFNCQ